MAAEAENAELQEFIAMETQKAQLHSQVHRMMDVCWERCVDKPRDKLDYRTEACLTNCVDRFVDTALMITNRFQQMVSQQMGGGH